MLKFWELWPQGFAPDYCDELVARAKELPATEGEVQYESPTLVSDPGLRRCIVRCFAGMGPDADIAGHVSTFASVANRQSFGFDLTSPYDIQCLEYHGADGGKFDWHQDVTWTQSLVSSRKLSFIAQLSDPADYEGGDFEFWGYPSPPPEFRNKGAVLVFPSFLHHRVLPVTKGVRYALVSWIEGPKFR